MSGEQKKFLPLIIILVVLLTLTITVTTYILTKEKVAPPVEVVPGEIITSADTASTSTKRVIGTSVEGRNIESYTFGNGEKTLLFVGGMHGGYEWNSVLLAYEFIDELEAGKIAIPDSLTIEIVPSLNPDGVYKVVGKEGRFTLADAKLDSSAGQGRFNAHNVDLNRNFGCKWQPKSMWRSKEVSAGTSAFSEPEAQALKKLVEEKKPSAVIFWHSQANAVYASECENGILPGTLTIMNTYAKAAGYKAVSSFDAYPVTGDAEGWLASIGIPAITVELGSHSSLEWTKNQAGVRAVLDSYSVAK